MAIKTNYTKNGKNYYRVTATVGKTSDGKPIRKEFYGKTKKEAEQKRDNYLSDVRNGLDINYRNMTIGDLMKLWLFEVLIHSDKIKPQTFSRYEIVYRLYVKTSPLNSIKISDIRQLNIQKYYNELSRQGKSKILINDINIHINPFFRYAVKQGFILKNPCTGIIIPSKNNVKHEIKPFTDEEIKLLRNNCKNPYLKMIINIGLGTGLRIGEIWALTENDFNFEENTIKVNKSVKRVLFKTTDTKSITKIVVGSPKTKSSNRTVPIPSILVSEIKAFVKLQKEKYIEKGVSYNSKTSQIFISQNCKFLDYISILNTWKKLLKNSSIEHRGLHSLRHTYATKLFEKNISIKTVSELLGHSSIDITSGIYIHVMPKLKVEATEYLNELFI